jgi:hypothetical protein
MNATTNKRVNLTAATAEVLEFSGTISSISLSLVTPANVAVKINSAPSSINDMTANILSADVPTLFIDQIDAITTIHVLSDADCQLQWRTRV